MGMVFGHIKGIVLSRSAIHVLALITAALITTVILVLPRDVWQVGAGYSYTAVFAVNLLAGLTVIIPTPFNLMTAFAGGTVLNPLWVGILSGLGAGLGEINGYLAGFGGKVAVVESASYRRIQFWIQRRGFLTIFVLAALPNPFFDIAGITGGLMGYSFWRFVLATCTGKTLKLVAFAFAGARYGESVFQLLW